MVVTCDHCGARYRFDDDRITGRGARITCPKCRHVFVVHTDQAAAEAVEELPPLDVHTLDFTKVGIKSWKVKVAIGLVYDFSDYKTLRKYIKEGRVTESDNLSHDNETWVEIGSLPDLKQHFIDVYREAEQAQAALIAAEEAAAEAAAHPTQEQAEAIADALLDAVATEEESPEIAVEEGPEPEAPEVDVEAEVDAEEDAPAPAPEEAAPAEEDQSADDIGDDLLAAMEAAVAAEDGGIDLDMDALLEQNKAEEDEAPKPRRNRESAALAQVQSTGNAEAQAHQFVDPFESLKQQRQARSKSRASRKSKGKSKAAAKESDSKRTQKIALVAVLLAVLGYLVFDYVDSQEPPPDPSIAAAQESKAQSEREAKRGEAARQKMQAKLKAELAAVPENEIEAFKVADEQLIPVGGPGAGVPAGSAPVQRGGMPPVAPAAGSSGVVEQRGTTAADHIAMAKSAASQGQWSQAAIAYGKALQMDPGNKNLRAQRGQALYRAGKKDDAEGELRQAAAAGSMTAHKVLGHLAAERGDPSGAVAHYQTYLRSQPRDRADIEKRIKKLTN